MGGSAPETDRVRVMAKVVGRQPAGSQEQQWELRVGTTLEAGLHNLAAELQPRVAPGHLQGCLVMLNGRNVQALAPDTLLHDGDTFVIIPPVAGG